MSADEARGRIAETTPEQGRTGPRHAAQRKPLLTRLHMPAGKAIAMAAMPTAVLMGMGFTPTLAVARDQPPNAKLADEYKDCVAALGGDLADDSASPSPSASGTGDAKDGAEDKDSARSGGAKGEDTRSDSGKAAGSTAPSSSDSGSDDKAEPAPVPASSAPAAASSAEPSAAAGSPSAGGTGGVGGVLGSLGDTIGDVLTGGKQPPAPSASPTPSASEPAPSSSASSAPSATAADREKPAAEPGAKATGTPAPSTDEGGEKASESPEASPSASATPSPSASASGGAEDCEKATEAVGGVDNKVLLPDDPWTLNASSLLLKGADYQGVVQVRTASGKFKKVLKYVISDGTDIGDLHQTVKDKASGKTYHVQAGKGTTSTIRDGDTTMYTESISGKLFGLIPITFSPDSPPPLNIPLIYFTDVTVKQAGQFGGTLTIPKLHQFAD
ncbi:hypothetical protein [Streptomyces sp. NPDC001781]